MKNDKLIISYRRKCRNSGQGTGLSHYILMTPKAVSPSPMRGGEMRSMIRRKKS